MPQVFQVLKCYKCSVFQIHQTKKSNKFQCKMCGEKQSIKRHYGLGNGLECRKHVQRLNAMRGELDESQHISGDDCCEDEHVVEPRNILSTETKIENSSKWTDFVDTEEVICGRQLVDDTMYLNDTEVVLELPKKRQKSLGHFKNRKYPKICENRDCEDTNNDLQIEPQSTSYNTSQNLNMHNTKQSPTTNIDKCNSQFQIDNNSKRKIQENSSPDWTPQPNNKSNRFQSENTYCTKDLNLPSHSRPQLGKENKCFVPPTLNKDSKWAKFADDDTTEVSDAEEENNLYFNVTQTLFDKPGDKDKANSTELDRNSELFYSRNCEVSDPDYLKEDSRTNPHKLFSLCDDNDIDDYLTI